MSSKWAGRQSEPQNSSYYIFHHSKLETIHEDQQYLEKMLNINLDEMTKNISDENNSTDIPKWNQ